MPAAAVIRRIRALSGFIGTKIDKDAFTEKIKEALDKMQPEFDLSVEGCYEDPKVKEEDPS